jgi:hypothetical protein
MPGFKGLAVPGPSNMPFRIRQAMDIAVISENSIRNGLAP